MRPASQPHQQRPVGGWEGKFPAASWLDWREAGGGGLSDTFGQWIRQVTESWQYWLQGEGISHRLGDSWQFQLFREETGNRLQQTGESLPNSGQLEAVSWCHCLTYVSIKLKSQVAYNLLFMPQLIS